MIKFYAFLAIILIVFGCQTKEDPYQIESDVLDCFYESYASLGIEVKKSIDSANAILVHFEVLPDVSGKSFMNLINETKNNGISFKIPQDLIDSINTIKTFPNGMTCLDFKRLGYDSTDVFESKIHLLFTVFDSIRHYGDVDVKLIAEDFLQTYDEQDFDQPFYSAIGTLILCQLIKSEASKKGISMLLPPKPAKLLPKESYVVLDLKLVKGDSLILKNEVISTSYLVSLIKDFVAENKELNVVKLTVDKDVSHELYIDVIDQINEGYDQLYDKLSLDKYQLSFSQLNKQQQLNIKAQYPRDISMIDNH